VGSRGRGYRAVEVEGFEILVGKGDLANDRLTFAVAEPRDFWLHVAGPAGSHVVVRNPLDLDELPRAVIARAAELAAWHSKARGSRGKVEVHVCRVADVKKPRGFDPGQVLLRRWDSIKVYPKGLEEPGAEPAGSPAPPSPRTR
jgi:predicted ribosome quality control (RQC) complex YloA/Tae2 family protein